MNLIIMQTDYEATHHYPCRCSTKPVKWRRWKPGERGRIFRRWMSGTSFIDIGITHNEIRYIIQYMRRIAPFRPQYNIDNPVNRD